MSSTFNSKPKDKKVLKDGQKASPLKPSGSNGNTGVTASAYNPLLGTFHTLEAGPTSLVSSLQTNGRFRNMDETDECDSISNNGSWSGESEEHKEKPSTLAGKQETIPNGDTDKREKIRQKNERKHQRQKEKRAQELHERCCSYLMSRKLEALAQQLVAMGFSHERATMALILNKGRVEESVAWLFEVSEETDKPSDPPLDKRNLKIDISEELELIVDMERKYGCTKQEVERAIVSTEGDLEKAGEILNAPKQDTPFAPPKLEETIDHPTTNNGKLSVLVGNQNSAVRPQTKVGSSSMVQRRRDEKEINYPKLGVYSESVNKGVQPLNRIQPKLEWLKSQQSSLMVDKRWPPVVSNPPVSFSLASSLHAPPQPPPLKAQNPYVVANEIKNLQQSSIREPVVVMQRSQFANMKQIPATNISSNPPITTTGWYPTNSNVDVNSNGFMQHIPSARSPNLNNLNTNQPNHPFHYHQQQQQNYARDSPGSSQVNGLWNRTSSHPTLAAASSLGLFSGFGSSDTSRDSTVDWTTGNSKGYNLDYRSIDWSLDRNSVFSRPSGSWLGGSTSNMADTPSYDFNISRFNAEPFMRHAPTNSNGVPILGLQEVGAGGGGGESSSGSREWNSPFEEKDMFNLPRQFVSSPSI